MRALFALQGLESTETHTIAIQMEIDAIESKRDKEDEDQGKKSITFPFAIFTDSAHEVAAELANEVPCRLL